MSSYADEFRRRQKEEKEKERVNQRQAAQLIQTFRGTSSTVLRDDLAVKKQKDEERLKKQEAQQRLQSYQKTQHSLMEEVHESNMKQYKDESRQKQRESQQYLQSVQFNEVKINKNSNHNPMTAPQSPSPAHVPDSERMKHDDDDLTFQSVKDKAGLFHHEWSPSRAEVPVTAKSPKSGASAATMAEDHVEKEDDDDNDDNDDDGTAQATQPKVKELAASLEEEAAQEATGLAPPPQSLVPPPPLPCTDAEEEAAGGSGVGDGGGGGGVDDDDDHQKQPPNDATSQPVAAGSATTATADHATPTMNGTAPDAKSTVVTSFTDSNLPLSTATTTVETTTIPVPDGTPTAAVPPVAAATTQDPIVDETATSVTAAAASSSSEKTVPNTATSQSTATSSTTAVTSSTPVEQSQTQAPGEQSKEGEEIAGDAVAAAAAAEPSLMQQTPTQDKVTQDKATQDKAVPPTPTTSNTATTVATTPTGQGDESLVSSSTTSAVATRQIGSGANKQVEQVSDERPLSGHATKVRLDVLFSFGLLTSSERPYLDNYMGAVEEVVQETLATAVAKANEMGSTPAANKEEKLTKLLAEHVHYDARFGPFVQEYSKDPTYHDPANRPNVQRVLVIAAIPIFLTNGISIKQARQGVCAGLQASMQNGHFIAIAKRGVASAAAGGRKSNNPYSPVHGQKSQDPTKHCVSLV